MKSIFFVAISSLLVLSCAHETPKPQDVAQQPAKVQRAPAMNAVMECSCSRGCGGFQRMEVGPMTRGQFEITIGDEEFENTEQLQYVLSANQTSAPGKTHFFDSTKLNMSSFNGNAPRLLVPDEVFQKLSGGVKVILQPSGKALNFACLRY